MEEWNFNDDSSKKNSGEWFEESKSDSKPSSPKDAKYEVKAPGDVEITKKSIPYIIIMFIFIGITVFGMIKLRELPNEISLIIVVSLFMLTFGIKTYFNIKHKKKHGISMDEESDINDRLLQEMNKEATFTRVESDYIFEEMKECYGLDRNSPALVGFRDTLSVMEDAAQYFSSTGKNIYCLDNLVHHFFRFDPIQHKEDEDSEYVFVEKLLSFGVKPVLDPKVRPLTTMEMIVLPFYKSQKSVLYGVRSPKLLDLLLSHGADMYECPPRRSSFVSKVFHYWRNTKDNPHQADECKRLAEVLDKYHFDVQTKDEDGHSLIEQCASVEAIEFLLARGARLNPNIKNSGGHFHPLLSAISSDNCELMEYWLSKGIDVNNICDHHGFSGLFYAQSIKMFNLLMNAGMCIDKDKIKKFFSKDNMFIQHPVANAAMNDDFELVEKWFSLGVDASAIDSKYMPVVPVFHAASVPMLELLMSHGGNIRKNYNVSFYHNAFFLVDNVQVANRLLELGIDIHARNKDGQTPLHFCSKPDMIRFFVDHGLDINARSKDRKTPLLDRIDHNDHINEVSINSPTIEMIRTMLDLGADIHMVDKQGHSAMYYAGNISIIRMFLERLK